MVGISTSDIVDNEINDSIEQLSDGYVVYNIGIISGCDSLTKTINIIPLSDFDNLINGENHIQNNDKIYIYNSTNADGYYTVNSILNSSQFTVFENIPNSINGNILYIHPSGASKIGFDHSKSKNITANTVQKALEQLDGMVNAGIIDNGGSVFAIWAEQNDSLSVNNYSFCFGDSCINAPGGIIIPFSCECFALGITTLFGNQYYDIVLTANTVETIAHAYLFIDSGSSNYTILPNPVHISAGDVINFKTKVCPSLTAATRVIAYFRANINNVEQTNEIIVRKNSGSTIGTRPKLNFCEGINTTLTLIDDSVNNEIVVAVSSSIPTIAIRKNSTTNIGTRQRLNLIESLNTKITAVDDPTDNEIDITINSQTTVRKNNNIAVGTRSRLNFIEGSGITITTADDSVNDEIDLTIASTPKKSIIIPFVLPESISAIEQWYYVSNWPGAANNKSRSGNASGIASAGNCIPYVIPFTGIITQCTCILKSSGTATSIVTYPVNFVNRLQLVSFTSISTLSDITIPISNSYTVGANALGNTNFISSILCNINVTQGNLIALKFINSSANNRISRMLNSYISLVLEES